VVRDRWSGWADPGTLDVIIAAVSLGSLATISAVAYQAGMTPAAFVTTRALLGAGILAAVVQVREIRWPPGGIGGRQRRLLAVAIATNGAMNLLLFSAFGVMAVALSMAVYYCYPLLVAVIDVALGRERATSRLAAACVAGFVGLVLVVASESASGEPLSVPGLALAGGAAVSQALFFVVSRDGYPSVPAEHATMLILLGGACLSGVAAVLLGELGAVIAWIADPTAIAMIVIAGTLGAAIAKLLLLRGVRAIGSTRAALLMLLEPLAGVAFAALFLGQAITPAQAVGGAAIIAAAGMVRPVGSGSPRLSRAR
jgi:drug/metabolite transporter (DMT)-like permease